MAEEKAVARARGIKPAFFKNELLGREDPLLSLLFISLWQLADREGRLENRPLRIKAETFPYREIPSILGLLEKLCLLNFIEIYEVGGKSVIQILNFKKHQTPHVTEKPSELPEKQANSKTTVKAPLNNGSTTSVERSDYLITDCLTPDFLIPEGMNPSDSLSACSRPGIPPDEKNTKTSAKLNGVPYRKILELYHECLPHNPRCKALTSKRKGQMAARWHSGALPDLDAWKQFFLDCGRSRFLTGQIDPQGGRRRFVADLEWLTNETNYAKILEGKYHRG